MATAYDMDQATENPIRSELTARIRQLDRDFRLLSIGELGRRVDAIRQLARSHGFEPASRLAGGLADALARDGRGAIIRPYIDGLHDAVFCDPADREAGDSLLASIGVRLAD